MSFSIGLGFVGLVTILVGGFLVKTQLEPTLVHKPRGMMFVIALAFSFILITVGCFMWAYAIFG